MKKIINLLLLLSLWFAWPALAAVDVFTGTFTHATTGNKVITGVGFTPKVIIIYGTGNTTGQISGNEVVCIGWATSTTDEMSMGTWNPQGRTSDDAGRIQAFGTGNIISCEFDTGPLAAASLTAISDDGFTVNFSTLALERHFHYIVYGGSDITDAETYTFSTDTDTGSQVITDGSFQADVVFAATVLRNTALGDGTGGCNCASFGWGVSSTERGAIGWQNSHNSGFSRATHAIKTDELLSSGKTSVDAPLYEADLTSIDATGMTINWSTAPATASDVMVLAIKGGQWSVGSMTQKTSAGSQAVTGAGFHPKGVMIMGADETTSTQAYDDVNVWLGAMSGGSEEAAAWWASEDNQATSDTDRAASDQRVVTIYDHAQALQADADFESFDSDGFTINWGTADATARQMSWLAVGDTDPLPVFMDTGVFSHGATGAKAVTGVGFTPKALILYSPSITSIGVAAHALPCFGFATSATDEVSISTSSRDAEDTSVADRDQDFGGDAILNCAWDLGDLSVAALTSFDSDGFTINFSVLPSTRQFAYIAFGGAGITDAEVLEFTSTTTVGPVTQDVTSGTFQPDVAFAMSIVGIAEGTATNAIGSLGWAASETQRGAMGWWDRDAQSPNSDVAHTVKTDEFISVASAVTDAIFMEGDFGGFLSNGISIDWGTTNVTGRNFAVLVMKGGRWAAGNSTAVITTPATKAVSGIGFEPTGLLMMGADETQGTDAYDDSSVWFGATSAANEQSSMWWGSEHDQNTTDNDRALANDKAVIYYDHAQAVIADADFDSFDTNGFTLDWTTVDGTARIFNYLVVGSTGSGTLSKIQQHQRRRH
jgi:hypothetical protein